MTQHPPTADPSEPQATKPALAMHWQIILAMLAAIPTIWLLKTIDVPFMASVADVIGLTGKLFLKLLKMVIMPLILASVVMSVAGFDNPGHLKRLGLRALLYYGATTMVAVGLGVVVVNLLNPGEGMSLSAAVAPDKKPMSASDLVLSMVPENIFDALTQNSAILSVIVFALLLGVATATLGEQAAGVRAFFSGLNEAMMRMTSWVMGLAPVGVFALTVTTFMDVGFDAIRPLALYMLTVAFGLALHGGVALPALYAFWTRRSPLTLARAMSPALLTAFSTASSSATLPLTMRCVERRAGVPAHISRFVLPLGATVNMDGTALYESVAAIFIAQAYGIHLGLDAQILVFATATLAAIGAAGVPGAGLVTLLIVLEAVNLPAEGYGLIVVVDRLLDMLRTTVNVWGDMCGAVIISKTDNALTPEDPDADILS
jgi:proton glutamate symport protein